MAKLHQLGLITLWFSSSVEARGCHAVTSHRAPSQKATDAERGAKRGVQAVAPGKSEVTIEACTPPMLKPLMPVGEHFSL